MNNKSIWGVLLSIVLFCFVFFETFLTVGGAVGKSAQQFKPLIVSPQNSTYYGEPPTLNITTFTNTSSYPDLPKYTSITYRLDEGAWTTLFEGKEVADTEALSKTFHTRVLNVHNSGYHTLAINTHVTYIVVNFVAAGSDVSNDFLNFYVDASTQVPSPSSTPSASSSSSILPSPSSSPIATESNERILSSSPSLSPSPSIPEFSVYTLLLFTGALLIIVFIFKVELRVKGKMLL